MSIQRKGRTLNLTISELLESPRFKIALHNFKDDPSFMRAILVELGLETANVVRSTLTKVYANHSSLPACAMIPLLRSINDFTTYNLHWGLSDMEMELYATDPKFKLTEDERKQLLDRVHKKFMQSNVKETSVE